MYSDKERIGRAFRALKKYQYETQAGKWCCGTCATSDFKTNRFVYYHKQDMDAFNDVGDIVKDKFYIGHGEDGDGWEIAKALTDQGLVVQWDGTLKTRIAVLHNDRINYTHPEIA